MDATLRLLGAFRAIRRDQLERFLLANEAITSPSRRVAAFRILGELRERGFVQAVVLPGTVATAGATRAYVLTSAGQRAYAADDGAYPRGIRRPSIVLLDHAIALADIALAFRDGAARAGDIELSWQADWEIVHELGCTTVIPDAFVTLERGGWRTRAFIEADRATERERAFANKVRRYVELYRDDRWRSVLGTWPLILTVTTSEKRARSLCRLAFRVAEAEGGARIRQSFRFASLDELLRRGAFDEIWHMGPGAERGLLLNASEAAPR
ncbi:MAG TPA: replication-relaxation family protein [Candidatus Limnocylindria bacterium]